MTHNSSSSSSLTLLNFSEITLHPDQEHPPAIHDLEKASEDHETPKRRICPYATAPSIFKILSLGVLFLGITAVVAGVLSGDWEASLCSFPFLSLLSLDVWGVTHRGDLIGVIAMLLILQTWIWLERVKIQEMKRSRCVYRGWNLGGGMNKTLYAWAGIGADGALLG